MATKPQRAVPERPESGLGESEQLFRALFEQSLLPMARFRPDGSFLAGNEAHRKLIRATPEAYRAMGSVYNVLRDEQLEAKGLGPLLQRAFAGEPVAFPAMECQPELTAVTRGWLSERVWLEGFAYPIKSADGTIQEVVLVQNDVSDRMKAVQAEREAAARLQQALEAGAVGLWEWDVRERRLVGGERCLELFGRRPETLVPPWAEWVSWLHPEDRERVRQALGEALQQASPYETEFRVVWPDGTVRWLTSKASVLCDEDGKARRMLGAMVDITERKRAEQALAERERRLVKAQEIGNFGYWRWDASQNAVAVSESLYEILGVAPGYFDPDPYAKALEIIHPDDAEKIARLVERALTTREPFEIEFRVVAPDRTVRHLVSRGEVTTEAEQPTMFGTVQDITEHKHAEEALRESQAAVERSHEQLRALMACLFTAQEEERRRVSRELHDDLNQGLAMLAVQVESLEQQLPVPTRRLREELGVLRDRLAELSDEVRRVAYQLHPSVLEHLGLAVALESCCADFSKREGIPIRFEAHRAPERLPPEVALCLYRVAQEALHNLARHSQATQATVSLTADGQEVQMSVADNGLGFDPAAARSKGGLGLVSMEERVRLADGTLSVQSRPGEGTTIQVRVPLRGHSQKVRRGSS